MNAVLEQTYPSRIEAITLLRNTNGEADIEALKDSAQHVRDAAASFGRAPAAKLWLAFAEAIDCIRFLEEWQRAVLSGEPDSDRLIRAARARLELIENGAGETVFEQEALKILRKIRDDLKQNEIAALRQQLASLPMPVAMYAVPEPTLPNWAKTQVTYEKKKSDDLAVAFLEFSINGSPAAQVQWLPSRQTNDLEIGIRVSRWPDEAEKLQLTPISIEPNSTFDLPTFEFERPNNDPPHLFRQRGRMVLHAPQSFDAHPYEFIYAAEFSPLKSEQPVIVAGQRTLRLDGTDITKNPITGYPAIDRKIIELREKLRLEPRIAESEVLDALTLLTSIGNLAGQAVQDARYPSPIYEAAFEQDVRQFLRQHPKIGVELEEQANSTGGRTDLSYRGIRIELKSERKKNLSPKDCEKFAEQAASYAVGTNRRLAFLCVLDSSSKTKPPFPVEDGLFIIPVETGTSPVYIVTCLIQGGLPKPSSLS